MSAPSSWMAWAAVAVVGLHVAFIAFVVAGGALLWRWPRVAWLHLPAVAWAAWVELAGSTCPLTPLENRWRVAGGEAPYATDFVAHYLLPLIYPAQLTRGLQLALGGAVVVGEVAVYLAWAWTRRRRRRGRRARCDGGERPDVRDVRDGRGGGEGQGTA